MLFFPLKDMPEITAISVNQTVNKDESISLNCTADGYPTPTITWTKVSDNSTVSFPLMITGKQNEGLYKCTADNGIGSTAAKEVFITVHCECLNVHIIDLYLLNISYNNPSNCRILIISRVRRVIY